MIDGVSKVIKLEKMLEAGATPAEIRAILDAEKTATA